MLNKLKLYFFVEAFNIEQLLSILLLLLILVLFTLFTYYAPYGNDVMGALATAAIATFLVEALQRYVIGDLFDIPFLQETGMVAGELSGVIVAFLVALAMKIRPQNAAILAVACGGLGLIPGMFASYIVAFLVIFIERKVRNGLDFIFIVLLCVPVARFIGVLITPLVDGSLLQIGELIQTATLTNPLIMGLLLGGIITVVGTSPLSSMALTAMLGLTGMPMAVAALSAFASSFMNATLLHKLKIGQLKSVVSIAIEPLSRANLVSANPIPMYTTNFVGGGLSGMVIAFSRMVNHAPGTAAPVPGLLVMFGYNPALQVLMYGLICALICLAAGYAGAYIFRNFPIYNSEVMNQREKYGNDD